MIALDCHPLSVAEDVGFSRVLKAIGTELQLSK